MSKIKREKRPVGRPQNDELLATFIECLETKPQTIKALADQLDMPRRTAYRYVELASEQGLQVVKLGFTRDAPYFIMKSAGVIAK